MSAPQKYRKIPIEVTAMGPMTQENRDEIADWCHGKAEDGHMPGPGRGITSCVVIRTLDGDMRAEYGDYVIREPFPTNDRRFYPCKASIFAATYEAVQP